MPVLHGVPCGQALAIAVVDTPSGQTKQRLLAP
jgi:hypothetical protein